MPIRTFAITADDRPVALDDKGAAEVTVNVSNTSAKPIRGGARLVPMGTARQEWLRINGEVERNFAAHEAHQYVVRITAPPGTPPGKHSFRLNIVSVQNPDEDYAEGPVVSFVVREAKAEAPPNGKKFPWFYVILALVVIGGGIVLTKLLWSAPKTPVVTWANPADIAYDTMLNSVQLDATSSVPGTFVYTPPAGTVLPAGTGQTLSVLFTPTDSTSYATTNVSVSINVRRPIPVYVYNAGNPMRNYYTTNPDAPNPGYGGGIRSNGIAFYTVEKTSPNAVPVYAYHGVDPLRYYYTTNPHAPNPGYGRGLRGPDRIAFYAVKEKSPNAAPVYVYVAGDPARHYYSTNPHAANPGYGGGIRKDGIAFWALPTPPRNH